MDGKPSQPAELFHQLLEDINRAVCQHDAQFNQEIDAETLQLSLQVLKAMVWQPVCKSLVLRVLGQGSQGLVQSVELEDGQHVARKVMILTASQVQEGSVLVGLQDIVWAASSCLGLGVSKLRKHLPICCALHIWGTDNLCQEMTSLGFSNHQHSSAGNKEGVSGPGVVVVMDMEQMSCNLTQFSKRCHVHGGDVTGSAAVSAVIQDRLRGTPVGSRWIDVRPWLHITMQVLMSVKQLHASRLIHCDLKPDNVLLKLDEKADIPGNALLSRITSVKLADLGAACVMDAHGCTNDAKLCTAAYLHPEKKCIRYEEEHVHHSSVQFDVVEACAALLEACLGLCPAKQLRNWLLCEPLHQLVFGEITCEQAKSRDAKALTYWKALQSIQQQGVAGQAFYALIQLLLHAWSTAGRVAIDAMVSEVQRLQAMCGVTKSRSASTDGATSDQAQPSSSCHVVDSRAGGGSDDVEGVVRYGVLLDGSLLPPTEAALDDLFRRLTSSQVQALCEVHPDTYNHWCAYEDRRARQGQAAAAAAPQVCHSTSPASGISCQSQQDMSKAAVDLHVRVNAHQDAPCKLKAEELMSSNGSSSSKQRMDDAHACAVSCVQDGAEHVEDVGDDASALNVRPIEGHGTSRDNDSGGTEHGNTHVNTLAAAPVVEHDKDCDSLVSLKPRVASCDYDGDDKIRAHATSQWPVPCITEHQLHTDQHLEQQQKEQGHVDHRAVSSSGTLCLTPLSGSHASLACLLPHSPSIGQGSDGYDNDEGLRSHTTHSLDDGPHYVLSNDVAVQENLLSKAELGGTCVMPGGASDQHVRADCTGDVKQGVLAGKAVPAVTVKKHSRLLCLGAVAAVALVARAAAGVGNNKRHARRSRGPSPCRT